MAVDICLCSSVSSIIVRFGQYQNATQALIGGADPNGPLVADRRVSLCIRKTNTRLVYALFALSSMAKCVCQLLAAVRTQVVYSTAISHLGRAQGGQQSTQQPSRHVLRKCVCQHGGWGSFADVSKRRLVRMSLAQVPAVGCPGSAQARSSSAPISYPIYGRSVVTGRLHGLRNGLLQHRLAA